MNVQLRIKRAIDVAGAATALVVLSPVMAIVAIAILLRMGRPVLFRQMRPGYRAEPFQLLKFRTMRESFDEHGRPLSDAERLTSLGRFLRRSSLDELPQLWNVLRGEMSLVGPRPLLMEYLDRYSEEQARRHEIKPGLTGLAQVRGRNALTWEEKFSHDVWYAEHWSLWLDLRILISTLVVVMRRKGISEPGHATMRTFERSPVDAGHDRETT